MSLQKLLVKIFDESAPTGCNGQRLPENAEMQGNNLTSRILQTLLLVPNGFLGETQNILGGCRFGYYEKIEEWLNNCLHFLPFFQYKKKNFRNTKNAPNQSIHPINIFIYFI